MKKGVLIKQGGVNILLVLSEITDSELFQIIPIISNEFSQVRGLDTSLLSIKKQLLNTNNINAEWVEIIAEII